MPELLLLFESAAGFGLFQKSAGGAEEIAADDDTVQQALEDPKLFGKMVELKAFHPFATAEEALAEMDAVAAAEPTDTLMQWLESNLPKKKKNYQLGVQDKALAESLTGAGYPA